METIKKVFMVTRNYHSMYRQITDLFENEEDAKEFMKEKLKKGCQHFDRLAMRDYKIVEKGTDFSELIVHDNGIEFTYLSIKIKQKHLNTSLKMAMITTDY